jgi:hypothetical protein
LISLRFVKYEEATEPFNRFGHKQIDQADYDDRGSDVFSGMGTASQSGRGGVL